jgi:hypothetical protein
MFNIVNGFIKLLLLPEMGGGGETFIYRPIKIFDDVSISCFQYISISFIGITFE